MNKEIPDPKPYPFLSIESNRMTITPANSNCSKMRDMFNKPNCEGGPYAPYHIWPAAYPKQRISANVFSNPYNTLLSLSLLTLRNPIAVTICMIQDADMMGPIPSSINVPLLDASMTLVQYRGSELYDLWIP